MTRRTTSAFMAIALSTALLAVPASVPAQAAPASPADDLKAATATPAKSLEKGTALTLGTAKGAETYIVQLASPAVPTRSTAKAGTTAARASGEAAYGRVLETEQASLTSAISRVTGAKAQVLDTFTHAINGITVRLTREQAQKVARIDGVTAVQVDFTRQLTTDKGPEWIGANTVWDGTSVPGGVGSKGEGVVVGILDSGINPANPSFHDVVPVAEGGDGFDHTNPRGAGTYYGVCDPTDESFIPDWGCNDKLIGYWDFDAAGATDGDYDDDGHGSHTGSTTAGNQVSATAYSAEGTDDEFSVTRTIKGVAPHANVIGYDVCDGAGCQGAAIIAAIDQAIQDEVDVINYSIGSSSASNPWTDADAVGFLNARAAGVRVATSAGNDGPGAATVGSPADVPWITSVGATTHDRTYVASVTDIAAGAVTLPTIDGAGLAGPTDGSFPLVDAATINDNALCLAEDFPSGTDLTGKIVICTRGGNGRVEKGQVVAALGAEGMVLVNDEASGTSLNGDAHALPAAHITYADGVALKAFLTANPTATAALSGSVIDEDPANGDIMAAFSSRGPNRAVSLMSPSVSAPGVDILAAAGTGNDVVWEFISGTSMASPHTAGAMALMADVQPEWTPAEVESALMTTSERDITDSDGTEADWFDMGAGRIELRNAAKAGFVLDETLADYEAANPATGGDVRTLNTASMADNECLQVCSWTRTLTGTATGAGTWTVSVENLSDGVTLDTDVDTVALTDGGTADVTVTATIDAGEPTDEWLFGALVLTPPAGSTAPVAHLPVGVLPSSGVLPTGIDVTTRRDAGSQVTGGLEAVAITDLRIDPSGLTPETRTALSVTEDPTNTDAFNGDGTVVTTVTVPAGATSMIASLDNPTAPDFDLYVGTGPIAEANVVAFSASGGSDESVQIANPTPGDYWVLVQNWEATTPGGTDTTDLLTAVVSGNSGNLRAEGPTGPLPAATPFDIRTFWDEPEMDAGETWHGTLTLGSSSATPGDIGVVPVTIDRVADDVTKTADVTTAEPGDTITYTVDVAPNVTPADLAYTISDTLPAGTTYVEGSATNGATFADGTISWAGTLPTAVGAEGSYVFTTNADDTSCRTPFGTNTYFDLPAAITFDDGAVGDSTAFTAFTAMDFPFYEDTYEGLTFTDDGFLVFGDANYGGTPEAPQSVPDVALPNGIAAALWQDLELRYDQATGSGVRLAATGGGDGDGDLAIIDMSNLRMAGDAAGANGRLDLQMFAVGGSRDLVFAFDDVTDGPILDGVTIGAENATGTAGTSLVNKSDASAVVVNDRIVCATYEGPDVGGETFTYQVKVADTAFNRQKLVNAAVHTTDDPGAEPVTASSTVEVTGAKERSQVGLTVEPNIFLVGKSPTARATVFSAGDATPTGTVEFRAGDRLAGTATIAADGTATAALDGFTSRGVFSITATYLGDDATLGSTSAPANVAVLAQPGPAPKVTPKVRVTAPAQVRQGAKARVGITVLAPRVTPTGKVRITVKAPGKKVTNAVVALNRFGEASRLIGRFRKPGQVKVTVTYLGDAAVRSGKAVKTIKVVKRRR